MAGVGAGIAAAWAAIGTIGGVVIGGMIQGIIIGAAVGALTAAVTGGDIGKGILFGAIGGAVIGGISGYLGGAGGSLGGASGGGSGVGSAGYSATTDAMFATGSSGGGGLLGGTAGSTLGAAVVTTGGQMLMKGFDDSGEIAQAEAQKNRDASKELAQLQADTQIKLEGMRSPGGGSNGDARYAADLQLQNAREDRLQARNTKTQDIGLLEEARARRASSILGIDVADSSEVDTSATPSINEQAMVDANKAYPTGSPKTLSGGVLSYA